MATQLTFRRGTSEPTQASGLTLGEPAFNTTLKTFHIGLGTGVTAAWVGARISGLSADIAAGLTTQVPTMSAVKDYVASTTSGVATLNSLTGSVTIAGGTNIGVTTASGSITVTNLGVQTFNGATGAVQGVSAAVAGTGISVSGATGSVTITNTGVQSFNGLSGAVTGVASIGGFTGTVTFSDGTFTTARKSSNDISINNVGVHTLSITSGSGINAFTASGTTGAISYSISNTGVTGIQAGTGISVSSTTGNPTITNTGVQSFNGLTGAVTGASLGANTFTALNTFNAGITTSFIYASTGSTFGGTLKVVGGATFDGRVDVAGILDVGGGVTMESTSDHTGAARFASTIVSTGSVTANGGLTASTLDVSGAARLASTLAVTGILTQTGGATFASTTDHTGAARFASTIVSTGSVTANGGLTASTLDVSGAARTTGDVTVGATLTVNGNFQVYGTLTTVNRTDLNIDDKTITMGRTLASDVLADGGGLSLSGTAARTWTWSNTRSAWESNQGVNVASTYGYAVNGTSVLTSSTLGSGVTGSSLTAVGTLATGVWQATAIGATYGGTGLTSYTIGDVIYASGTGSLSKLGGVTAGYLLSANGAGTAPEYKQVLIKDGGAATIATISSGAGTLTATIQYATASLKGVASFDNTNFTVSTGAVTITGVDGGTY
tara:strand:- start:2619 stop:4625 length:2007 start_codon:yes stop_codon:yes gene_type:complete